MLVLHNVRMVSSNVRKKNKGTAKCDKSTVTCDVSTAQCEDGTIKCEKKKERTTECEKIQSHVMLVLHNIRMIPSNMRKKEGNHQM